jgi:uncharacterized membrane protein (UPF0127 family)
MTQKCGALMVSCGPVLRFLAGAVAVIAIAATTQVGAQDCQQWRTAFAGMRSGSVTIVSGDQKVQFPVKVADDDQRRAAGFQCATRDEIEHTKILFDFGLEIMTAFHMQNVVAPLDIAFAKADGKIFSIQRMTPSPTALYQPMGAFRYAVETHAGFFERAGIRAGQARLVIARGDKSSSLETAVSPTID